ncbi:hypothetical protein L9F63_003936, partial [Diploptera punctata]
MNLLMGMRELLALLLFLVFLQDAVSPPVTQKKKGHEDNKVEGETEGEYPNELLVEYDRYLKEVVSALENDPVFKAKLEKAEESDIRTGKIASELENVDHRVRSQLDEIKRTELERLRHLATKEFELKNGMDTDHLKIPEHVDHTNPHTFEIEDLRKLILKTTADLAEADRKRREEFKEYEMQKEFEKQEQLKELDEEHKKELIKDMEEKEKKHKEHEPLHHPGSKQQLEEVWEKQDHMESQEFNPRTFFHLHDLDGNGVWDADEVKALFLKELDKMYTAGAPEDDMRERMEEMERMREHVFKEADTNRDGLISYEEFLAQTQKPELKKTPDGKVWMNSRSTPKKNTRSLRDDDRRRYKRLIAQGVLPPHPHGMPPPHPGYQQHPGQVQYQQQFPSQQYPGIQPGQQYGHPNQIPQGQIHPNQVHQGYVGQGQMYPGQAQGQIHPGQAQGQIHPGQAQGQIHPGQAQGQIHPGQAQGHPGQIPPAQQGQIPPAHQGQIPPAQQGQIPPGQVQNQMSSGQTQGQIPPAQQQGQIPPAQVPQGQAAQQQPGQAAQVQPGQQQQQLPSKTVEEGQNINIQTLPKHVPQPIQQRHEPIDLNEVQPE